MFKSHVPRLPENVLPQTAACRPSRAAAKGPGTVTHRFLQRSAPPEGTGEVREAVHEGGEQLARHGGQNAPRKHRDQVADDAGHPHGFRVFYFDPTNQVGVSPGGGEDRSR